MRLEAERKERHKQKEKERKMRRKLEGKPVTKKEREAEARRQAHLVALQDQGVWVCACDVLNDVLHVRRYGGTREGCRREEENSVWH